MNEMIFIASDHAGFDLKKQILNTIKEKLIDLGTYSEDSVDYPDYAKKLVSKINSTENSKGILICGSGIGMSIEANRDRNIRAGLAFEPEIAKLMREHNDANVLVLPAKFMNVQDVLKCIENFLTTNFAGGRHQKRINKLS
jgi:ribose 5-phosphate isomerase B